MPSWLQIMIDLLRRGRYAGAMNEKLKAKCAALEATLRSFGFFALGYSGGMDSSFLLQFSRARSLDVLPVSVLSPFTCFDDAAKICASRDVLLLKFDDLPGCVLENTPDRCYLCKKHVFAKIASEAALRGCAAVCDGSNCDDASDYRPGKRALRELGVLSPLEMCGFSKADIVQAVALLSLDVETHASNSCLATRLPYGTRIDFAVLKRIDEAEKFIRSLGFSSVRVREHSGVARIEVESAMRGKFAERDIMDKVSLFLAGLGFSYSALDLRGYRRGSMNETISENGGGR